MVHQLHVSFNSNLHLCLAVYVEIIFTHLSIDISSVQFILEYASIVWSPYYTKNINKIEHRVARFVFNDYDRTTSASELLQRLSWPPLQHRRACVILNWFAP